ncbi:MAG TPA: acetate/propionate family kinase [Miltoncostaeaceae bacterium]|jgi:acetate kinase|nr:acetate/propionate family kinase [Miltoncostaeaceae bacterium]
MGDVLVMNAGSTNVKLSMVDDNGGVAALDSAEEAPRGLEAVGHRIVHGGERFREPVLLDDDAMEALGGLSALAPLHNGPALRIAREARERFPGVPHVAVFDTAFHATIPEEASAYAIPRAWRRMGIRRYGFHGLSVEWATERAAAMLGAPPARLVVCHIGGGASATAVLDGRSADTTMGFSPLEGLVMATRAGSLDPDIPLHLILRRGLAAEVVERACNEESGLLALAGTADMREVEGAASTGDGDAARALAVHDHRLAGAVAAMAAALGGLDALVFTGGAGEASARLRAEAGRRLAFLGVRIDGRLNASAEPDADVSAPGAPARTLVVRAREEVVIARAVRRALASAPPETGGQ